MTAPVPSAARRNILAAAVNDAWGWTPLTVRYAAARAADEVVAAWHRIPSDPNPFPRLRLWGRRRETLSDDRSDW